MIKDIDKIKTGGKVFFHNTRKVIKDYFIRKKNIVLIFDDNTSTEELKHITFIFSNDEEYNNVFNKSVEKFLN